jgi:hypothetical protein
MNGHIGWQASPSNVVRPTDQRGSGSRSNMAQIKQALTAAMIVWIFSCQSAKIANARAMVARSVQSSQLPSVVLGPTHEIEQPPARGEVMHEVPAGIRRFYRRS